MLKVACLNLQIAFTGTAKLPRWMGSAFRGGLGQHLKRIFCFHPMRDCENCELSLDCLFYVTYQKPFAKRGYSPPPRPIILVPPFFGREIEVENAKLNLKLIMLGKYYWYLPHVLLAFQHFGNMGLGDARAFGQNKFELEKVTCEFCGKVVYDGNLIHSSKVCIQDVKDFPLVESKNLRIRFRTPIELPLGFPPPPDHLLKLIRLRLLLLVNEYGSGEKIPNFKCKGSVKELAKRHHVLIGYSQRSGRREFWNCWTGLADYHFEKLDKTAQWLLGVGRVLGAGAKSSFGLGFMDIQPLG